MKAISEQLTDIYYKHEHWHAFKMPYNQAIRYHTKRIKNGDMQVYLENGEVLGYNEWHFVYTRDSNVLKSQQKRFSCRLHLVTLARQSPLLIVLFAFQGPFQHEPNIARNQPIKGHGDFERRVGPKSPGCQLSSV